MKYLVRPPSNSTSAKTAASKDAVPVELYGRSRDPGCLTAGAALLEDVRHAKLSPSARAWDFLTIALSAVVADQATLRSISPDGWTREISLDIALSEPEVWQPQLGVLTRALQFLTTDIWEISATEKASVPFKSHKAARSPEADCVALLSGGLDSLVGGIDLVEAGRKPFFVSHTVRGDADKQAGFAGRIGRGQPFIQLNHNADTSRIAGSDETSQRVRSLVFIAYGVLVASTVSSSTGAPIDLYVNENGFISINPPLTPMRIGSLSTRTAHPRFLGLLQEVFDATGLNVQLVNPYRLRTKGQMMLECREQNLLTELAHASTSCGRFQRYNYQHCGRCLPCQVRRAAFLRWDHADTTRYHFEDLGRNDADHAAFDDVRAIAIARLTVLEDGFASWVGGALSWVPPEDRDAAATMLNDALNELGQLHDHYNVI